MFILGSYLTLYTNAYLHSEIVFQPHKAPSLNTHSLCLEWLYIGSLHHGAKYGVKSAASSSSMESLGLIQVSLKCMDLKT